MPEFTVVEKQFTGFQELRKTMSPELEEAFLNACLRASLSEDDWIHTLFAFQGELFTAALDIQMKAVQAALDGALSARQAENKKLAQLLASCQASLRDSIADGKVEADRLRRQIDDLRRDITNVHKAAQTLNEIYDHGIWIALGVALLFGGGLTLAIEHLILHL